MDVGLGKLLEIVKDMLQSMELQSQTQLNNKQCITIKHIWWKKCRNVQCYLKNFLNPLIW